MCSFPMDHDVRPMDHEGLSDGSMVSTLSAKRADVTDDDVSLFVGSGGSDSCLERELLPNVRGV